MSEKSRSGTDNAVVALLDERTLAEVERLAARYGVDPREIVMELIRMDLETRPEGMTVH